MRAAFRGALVVAAVLIGTAARSQPQVAFWFAAPDDPTGAPITNLTIPGPGQSFSVSVWYQSESAFPHNAVNAFVGFDRTTTEGTGAVPLDNQLVLDSGAVDSLSDFGFDYTLGNPALAGGASVAPVERPYGLDVPLEGPLGQFLSADEPTKLFDVRVRNQAVTGNYEMVLWNGGLSDAFSSFLVGDGILAHPDQPAFLNLSVMPEPGTFGLIAPLLPALALVRRRRLERAASAPR
jgi:hypothetical protein